MRYRVNSYSAAVTQVGTAPDTLTISFGISQSVYNGLPSTAVDLKTAVTEAIRLIADETKGGYLLAMTGQKSVVDSVTKSNSGSTYTLAVVFKKADLSTAADGDTDDLAAISNIFGSTGSLTDQFTIELDFGEQPSALAKENSVNDGTYTAIGELRDNNHGLPKIYNDMYKGVQMVSHPTSDTSVTIQPNVFNVWAAVDSNITTSNPMVITKGTDIPTVVNEYQIRIANTNNAAIGVTFSGFSIEWGNGYAPSFNAGFEYDISIVDGVGVWTETQIPSNS